MRAVIQRVSRASVAINNQEISKINQGLLILLGVEESDGTDDVQYLTSKIVQLRIFADSENKMNLNIGDISGEVMLVSQFTLHASTKKGNRPSFIRSARAEKANELYDLFQIEMQKSMDTVVQTGVFGAMMDISLVNHGPVTILMDSKNKE
jgi:D-tyrosyl-tRNA(Tyr) deacylase